VLRRLVPLLLTICGVASAQEAPENPLAPMDLSGPRATYQSFLEASRAVERTYIDYRTAKTAEGAAEIFYQVARASRTLDLRELPAAQREEVGSLRAAQLFDILLRLPELDTGDIPGGSTEEVDSWTIPDTEIEIARIAEGPRAGEFLFTAETVARLPDFHDRIISYPPRQPTTYLDWTEQIRSFTGPLLPYAMVDALPQPLLRPFLGTQVWKALLTFLIWIAVGVATAGWALVVRRRAREDAPIRTLVWRMTVPGLLAVLAWLAHAFAVYQTSLAGTFANTEVVLTTIVTYAAFAWLSVLLCRFAAELVIALPAIPDRSYDAHLLRLLARVGGIAASIAILVYGADQIGIPALGLIAGVGVGGVALALAAQSTVENLFGGVSIFADRPFRIGDFIQFGAGTGVVEAIGPRSTRLRGLDGTLATVPNSDLARMHVVNFSARNKCLFVQTLGLRYETTRLQLEWILTTMRRRLAEHQMVERSPGMPRVRLVAFGNSSIDVEVRAHVLTSDFGVFLEIQEELLLELQEIIEAGGSGFAYPSQTLYLGRDGGLNLEAKTRAESAALEARGKREVE